MPRLLAFLAALCALLAAAPSWAQASGPLGDGRTVDAPATFEGCDGDWSKTEGGSSMFVAKCDMTLGAGPVTGLLMASIIAPGLIIPETFIEGMQRRLGKQGPIQGRTMALKGAAGRFVCWVDKGPGEGMAVCALEGPSASLTVMMTGPDGDDALSMLERIVAQLTIR